MNYESSRPALIALDLDGTLLNSAKELTPRSRRALESAAAAGIEIVPATGRFFRGIPEPVRALPFLHYAITINGAQVLDIQNERSIYSAPVPLERTIEVLTYLDTLPVMYSCYQDDWGFVTEDMRRRAEDYIDYAPSLDMLNRLHTGVPELKAFLTEKGRGPQKFQLFTRDRAFRDRLLRELPERYPDLQITNAMPNNIEFNAAGGNKGAALSALAEHLGLDRERTMAFGDGLNDIAMLRAAGCGVAMENAWDAVKAAAERIAPSCDADGVAAVIEELLNIT